MLTSSPEYFITGELPTFYVEHAASPGKARIPGYEEVGALETVGGMVGRGNHR